METAIVAIVDFVLEAVIAFVNSPDGDKKAQETLSVIEGATPEQASANAQGNEVGIDVAKRLAELADSFLKRQ